MLSTKVIFKDKKLKGERLELTAKGALYFLGPNLELEDCDVALKVPAKNLLIRGQCHFSNCRFDVQQELRTHQEWVFASLKGCRFKGRLSGCDFGHWPTYPGAEGLGFIEDCDFSEALLDGCRFMGCDPRTLRFPRWPCFTFVNPLRQAAEIQQAPWPFPDAEVFIDSLLEPDCLSAVTVHAIREAKRYQTTPEALHTIVETLDHVVF